jgi:hypothetical protein
LTAPKYENPRSKVRGRADNAGLMITIPEKIAFAYRLKKGDKLEWMMVREGLNDHIKISKVID